MQVTPPNQSTNTNKDTPLPRRESRCSWFRPAALIGGAALLVKGVLEYCTPPVIKETVSGWFIDEITTKTLPVGSVCAAVNSLGTPGQIVGAVVTVAAALGVNHLINKRNSSPQQIPPTPVQSKEPDDEKKTPRRENPAQTGSTDGKDGSDTGASPMSVSHEPANITGRVKEGDEEF